jgi:hypothetical protein
MSDAPGSDKPEPPPVSTPKDRALPYAQWWPIVMGALAGVLLRVLFMGKPGGAYAPMMASFIYLAPLLVGAITVYLAERTKRRSWSYYFIAPFYANVLFVLGTLIILIEGIICAIVIIPVFALFGALGGLVMGLVCRLTNWPKQTLYSLGALPLILGFVEAGMPVPERVRDVERALLIAAPPERIWNEIHNAREIRPEEMAHAWLFRIGVPLPQAGVTTQAPEGRVRRITMGKAIHFEQVAQDWQENRHVRWTYRYAEDSFPPYALDEHVVLGGHYFDLKGTSYTLTPKAGGTELRIRMTYRVSTQFNWYADPVAEFLFGNLQENILERYRKRSEAKPS